MSTLDKQPAEPAAAGPTASGDERPLPPAARERFIPLRKADVVAALTNDATLSAGERAQIGRFCRLVDVLLHAEFYAALEELKNVYAPFDPDADTRPPASQSVEELDRLRGALFEKFGWLLGRGNYVRLATEDIHRSLADRSHWGLNLDLNFEIFERLEVYCRGDVVGTRFRRRLRNRFRSEAVEVPVYQRLAVIFRLRPDSTRSQYLDTEDVYVKLFKDIPKADLDMLLPGTQVKMSLIDRTRIVLPSLSGIAFAVAKLALALTLTPYLVWGVVGGTVGYSARTVYGYLNTRQKYQLNLTQSLYFQTLDNNSGAIHRLLDDAEEQETREIILAYFFLWREAVTAGLTADEIDRRIENYLHTHVGTAVDFEIHDALAKLERLQLAVRDAAGKWLAVPIERALETLARRWTELPS
ncbi:MAG: TMEM143 family protein [Pirellulales bacterium]